MTPERGVTITRSVSYNGCVRTLFILLALGFVFAVAACGGSGHRQVHAGSRGDRVSALLRAGGVLVEGSGGVCAGRGHVFFSPYVRGFVASPPPTVCDGHIKLEPVGHGVRLGSAYVRGVYRNGVLTVIAQGQPRHQQLKPALGVLSGLRRVGTTPLSGDERAWLNKVKHPSTTSVAFAGGGKMRLTRSQATALRRKVLTAVAASGATLIRLTIRPAPDLVVATSTPAAYLKHRLGNVLQVVRSGRDASFVEVVNRKAAKIFEFSYVPGEGSLYVRPDLDQCSPVMHSELQGNPPPPCPVS